VFARPVNIVLLESRRVNPNSPRPLLPFETNTGLRFRNTIFVVQWHLSPADRTRLLGAKKMANHWTLPKLSHIGTEPSVQF
jgi:hypothetical protein